MAGDWIARQKGLSKKPEVISIARATGRHRRFVAETLCEFWDWCDEHSSDGCLGVLLEDLSGLIEETDLSFWQAVVSVGWLRVSGTTLTVPHFERWLGNSAKKRLQGSQRQRRHRSKVTLERDKSNAGSVTTSPLLYSPLSSMGNEGAGARGPPIMDLTPMGLAAQWCFRSTRRKNGYPADKAEDITPQIEELVRQGYSLEKQRDAINDSARNRNEQFWQFEKRLRATNEYTGRNLGQNSSRIAPSADKLAAYRAKTVRIGDVAPEGVAKTGEDSPHQANGSGH